MAFASGQCTNYKLQSNQYKRSSGYQLTANDVAISDNFLSEGWYRFKSRAGNDMVTSAPSLTKCGTIYPVWLNGSLPNIGDDIVNTTACVVGVAEECESRISIRIANCGSFNVYYLRRTPAFATGYCFGDQVKCPYGLGSENGFTPGCKSFLDISVSPKVAVDLEKGSVLVNGSGPSMMSFFECAFNNPTNNMLYFDIIWYINEDEVRRTRNANYGNLSSTRLLPEHWVHQYNLNMVVRCAVRVRASAGGTPSHEMSSSDYQAGIFPESFIYHIKEGTTIAIPLRVTYPVGCLSTSLNNTCQTAVYLLTPFYQPSVDTCQNIPSKDAILFDQKQCGIIVTRETWRDTAFLNVTGNIDNLINNDGDREIFIRIGILGKGSEFSGAWDNVTVPDIKVYISDMDNILSDRICKLQTDPRFWTFDGKRHDIYSAGEFVLYRHKKRSIEVRALFTACSGTGDIAELNAACTCGVAIRVEDSLYVYRTCGLVSYRSVIPLIHHSAIYEICDDEHMVISTDKDNYTIISLPSGTRVKYVVYKNWIQHLHIIPSVFDIDNVEGICGNPNGNDSDDFVAPDGRTPESNERRHIDDIIKTWKVDLSTSSSLFSANPVLENTAHDRQKYCSCATEASDGNVLQDHAAVCNITKTIVECSKHQTTASFHTTCGHDGNTGRKRRALSEDGLSEKSKRVRRSTTDFDDVIDFVPLLLDPLYNSTYIPQIPTWRKGWNESIAKQLCEESINNDPVKLECEKHIDIQKMVNDSISSCVLDIRDSASTDWMAGTIDAIKSYCLTRISMYEKFYITNPSEEKPVVKIFKSVTCVNNCSKHGICTDEGNCLCDTGFIGADCSHPINKPPENIVLPEEGLCRQSIRPCAKTNIVGSFLSGTTIYVKLKIYKISVLGKGMVTNIVKTTAQYRAPNLITVDLDSSSRNRKRSVSSEYGLGFDISLSYDNTNFGEDLTFIIYDDSCYSCNSTTVSCTMLDSCLNIPTETSTRTRPSDLSPTFSQVNTNMVLIIASAILVALIMVGVILFLKCKNKFTGKKYSLYYTTKPIQNRNMPINTYEHIYDILFSPPRPEAESKTNQNIFVVDMKMKKVY